MIPGAEEVGKTTRSFFEVFREGTNPLSLALIAVVAGLVVLLYYSQSQTLEQRRETSALIIGWQRDTDKLMANCVSQDVTKMMMENIQLTTKTMLDTAQTDISRMQTAIDKEREINRQMLDRLIPPARPQQFFPQGQKIEYEDCDPLGPYCGPLERSSAPGDRADVVPVPQPRPPEAPAPPLPPTTINPTEP